jgi:hypothetical protein
MKEERCDKTGFYASFPWVYPSDDGKYVLHADYAALQAENERLNERVRIKFEKIEDPMDEYLNQVLRKNCAKLEAENERLRKAGDALVFANEGFIYGHPYTTKQVLAAIYEWSAAKGVQP